MQHTLNLEHSLSNSFFVLLGVSAALLLNNILGLSQEVLHYYIYFPTLTFLWYLPITLLPSPTSAKITWASIKVFHIG